MYTTDESGSAGHRPCCVLVQHLLSLESYFLIWCLFNVWDKSQFCSIKKIKHKYTIAQSFIWTLDEVCNFWSHFSRTSGYILGSSLTCTFIQSFDLYLILRSLVYRKVYVNNKLRMFIFLTWISWTQWHKSRGEKLRVRLFALMLIWFCLHLKSVLIV